MGNFLAFASGIIVIEGARLVWYLLSTRKRQPRMTEHYKAICWGCDMPRDGRIAP